MAKVTEQARLLERLAASADVTPDEREALLAGAESLRARAPAAGAVPGEERTSRRREPAPKAERAEPDAGKTAILWTDGAARGNPGPAGAGAILKTAGGSTLATVREYLGHTTNNVAEYTALLLGLRRALELGVERIEVRADSQLLIRQLGGQYRVKSEQLRPLYEQARELLAQFAATRLQHVPRAQNSEADRLANEGIDLA